MKAKNFSAAAVAATCFGFPLFSHKQNQVKVIQICPALCVCTNNENGKLSGSGFLLFVQCQPKTIFKIVSSLQIFFSSVQKCYQSFYITVLPESGISQLEKVFFLVEIEFFSS